MVIGRVVAYFQLGVFQSSLEIVETTEESWPIPSGIKPAAATGSSCGPRQS